MNFDFYVDTIKNDFTEIININKRSLVNKIGFAGGRIAIVITGIVGMLKSPNFVVASGLAILCHDLFVQLKNEDKPLEARIASDALAKVTSVAENLNKGNLKKGFKKLVEGGLDGVEATGRAINDGKAPRCLDNRVAGTILKPLWKLFYENVLII